MDLEILTFVPAPAECRDATHHRRSDAASPPAFISSPSATNVPRFPRPAMPGLLALILAGGRGTRLNALTAWRAKPAVPFAGGFRIIDFTLGNCFNSGIQKIGVLTQYQAQSLQPHLQDWARFASRVGRSLSVLSHSAGGEAGYCGTADAVYRNLDFVGAQAPDHVLVLAGDHVYNMDYGLMLDQHRRSGARVTVGCVEVPLSEASAFGVMQIDERGRICGFAEKPAHPQAIPGRSDTALASMGIYLFDTGFLSELLRADAQDPISTHDFGHDVIPAVVARGDACAHRLRDVRDPSRSGYWRDVGTVDAYSDCNLELLSRNGLDGDPDVWPLWNAARLQAARPQGKALLAAAISATARVLRSVLSADVRVDGGSRIEDSVLLPGVRIGPHCRIRKAIIEEGCELPEGSVIGEDPQQDRMRFHLSPGGTVLVTAAMLRRQALAA